jgi:hypothetical protein
MPVERGDQASFGSGAFNWWIDHIIRLRKTRKFERTLTCYTQRSGKMLEREELILIEQPLHFEIREDMSSSVQLVMATIRAKKTANLQELKDLLGLAESTIKKATRELIKNKKIHESGEGEWTSNE